MRTFVLQTDDHYGWEMGNTHAGELVIVTSEEDIFFDCDGKWLRHAVHQGIDDRSGKVKEDFERRRQEIIARLSQFKFRNLRFLIIGYRYGIFLKIWRNTKKCFHNSSREENVLQRPYS